MFTIHGAQLKKSREKLHFWSPLLWSLVVVLSSKYRWLWRWSQNTHDTSCGSIDWYNMSPLGDILQTDGSISISMRFTFSPKPKISVLTFIHFKIFKYTRCRYLWFQADFHTHIYYIFINILHIYIYYVFPFPRYPIDSHLIPIVLAAEPQLGSPCSIRHPPVDGAGRKGHVKPEIPRFQIWCWGTTGSGKQKWW